MNTHEKAEKLHSLGHEVAAAALRRSVLVDPNTFDHTTFQAIRQPRHQLGRMTTADRMSRLLQPGFVYSKWSELVGDQSHRVPYNALRVGKHIGPVTQEEMRHVTRNSRWNAAQDHPLTLEGHGLHSSDPSASSFAFLKQHIDSPHVWPIVADKFEEDGGTWALAMAQILRGHVDGGNSNDAWNRHFNERGDAPVTWPIRIHRMNTHPNDDMERYILGRHHIAVPKHLNTKEGLE